MSERRRTRGRHDDEASVRAAETIAPLWTVGDVATFLQVPVQTVYAWRAQGTGPRGRKVGKYLRYRPEDVVAWFEDGAA